MTSSDDTQPPDGPEVHSTTGLYDAASGRALIVYTGPSLTIEEALAQARSESVLPPGTHQLIIVTQTVQRIQVEVAEAPPSGLIAV